MTIVGNLTVLLSLVWAITVPPLPPTTASASAETQLALDLYEQLHGSEGNLCLSPSSLSSALKMTLAGARGRTETQIAELLRVEETQAGRTAASIAAGNDGQLLVANALWGQLGFEFREDYLSSIREHYGAGFEQVDFVNDTPRARRTINDWATERTDRRIDELLVEGDLDSDTVLVLTNAVYFDGRWTVPFDENRTADAAFRPAAGPPVRVPFMQRTDRFALARDEQLAVLELPYEGGRFSMVLLLPHDDDGLRDVEESLSSERLAGWLDRLAPTPARVRIPRFTIDTRLELTETLQTMGMTDAFTDRADFSGMSPQRGLVISTVVQSVRIEVDEAGTEGAAGSAVVIKKGRRPEQFVANHPFLFLVRDRWINDVLFIGRVANPAP